MSDNSSKVRKEIDSLSTEIQLLVKKYDGNDHDQDLYRFLGDIQKELKRLQRAFDTRRFFVVTIGALKAGKSTLINALTGYRVSPDGTGAETTKKCSIIMSADDEHKEEITLYRYKKATSQGMSDEDRQEICKKATRSLMDYFKGICDWNEDCRDFEKRPYPLHGHTFDPVVDNLDYILTSSDFSGLQQFRDFMLAEIRIKTEPEKNSVLSQNVAIIDMPGLDGLMAGVDSNEVNPAGNPVNFLPLYSHLFLLVQSSISGLNRTTASKLKEWQAEKKSTPVYLVFNDIRSKSEWHRPESITNESEERQTKALSELKHQNVFYRDCYTVNAAQAWESCQPAIYKQSWQELITNEKLWQKSNIMYLIEALQKDFSEQKDRIIQEDAVNGVSNALKEFRERAEGLKSKAKNEQKKLNDELDIWEKITQCLNDCNNEIDRKSIRSTLGVSWNEIMEKVVITQFTDATKDGAKFIWLDDTKGKLEQVEQLAQHVKSSIQTAHVEQGFLEAMNASMKNSFDQFSDKFANKLEEMKNDYPQYGDGFESAIGIVRRYKKQVQNTIPELQIYYSMLEPDPVNYVDQEELSHWWSKPWFQGRLKKYGKRFEAKFRRDFLQKLRTTIKEDMISYCITSDPHSDCLLNRMVKAVEKSVQEKKMEKTDKLHAKIAQDDEIIELIPNLEGSLENLDKVCTNFEREISL